MNYQLIFRSPFGRFGALTIAVIGLFFTVVIWINEGFSAAAWSFVLPFGLAYFTWWIWAWPEVIADERGVLVRNQLRTFQIAWDHLVKAEARFGLYLYVTDGEPTSEPSIAAQVEEVETEAVLATLSSKEKDTLTIGEVAPITLDPDDLMSKRAIYAAGVPARGGLRAAASQQLPDIPELDLAHRNRVALRVSPLVAARILDEEKYYVENPAKRPAVHTAALPLESPGKSYEGVSARYNLWHIGGFAVIAATWLWMMLGIG